MGTEAVEVFVGSGWPCGWAWIGVGCLGLLPFGSEDDACCCCACEILETLRLGSEALPSICCRCLPLLGPGLSVRPEDEELDFCTEIPALLSLVFNEPSTSKETAWLAPSEHQHHCTSSGAKGL
jgi:hypothetical protein